MAEEIIIILHKMMGKIWGLIVIKDRETGIITYGKTLDEAGNILIRH
jgi:hypothetical protein